MKFHVISLVVAVVVSHLMTTILASPVKTPNGGLKRTKRSWFSWGEPESEEETTKQTVKTTVSVKTTNSEVSTVSTLADSTLMVIENSAIETNIAHQSSLLSETTKGKNDIHSKNYLDAEKNFAESVTDNEDISDQRVATTIDPRHGSNGIRKSTPVDEELVDNEDKNVNARFSDSLSSSDNPTEGALPSVSQVADILKEKPNKSVDPAHLSAKDDKVIDVHSIVTSTTDRPMAITEENEKNTDYTRNENIARTDENASMHSENSALKAFEDSRKTSESVTVLSLNTDQISTIATPESAMKTATEIFSNNDAQTTVSTPKMTSTEIPVNPLNKVDSNMKVQDTTQTENIFVQDATESIYSDKSKPIHEAESKDGKVNATSVKEPIFVESMPLTSSVETSTDTEPKEDNEEMSEDGDDNEDNEVGNDDDNEENEVGNVDDNEDNEVVDGSEEKEIRTNNEENEVENEKKEVDNADNENVDGNEENDVENIDDNETNVVISNENNEVDNDDDNEENEVVTEEQQREEEEEEKVSTVKTRPGVLTSDSTRRDEYLFPHESTDIDSSSTNQRIPVMVGVGIACSVALIVIIVSLAVMNRRRRSSHSLVPQTEPYVA